MGNNLCSCDNDQEQNAPTPFPGSQTLHRPNKRSITKLNNDLGLNQETTPQGDFQAQGQQNRELLHVEEENSDADVENTEEVLLKVQPPAGSEKFRSQMGVKENKEVLIEKELRSKHCRPLIKALKFFDSKEFMAFQATSESEQLAYVDQTRSKLTEFS